MEIHSEDNTYYTTQYQEAFLPYVENEYCAKHRHCLVIKPESILNNNLFFTALVSRTGCASFSPDDFSSADDDYIKSKNVAEMRPRQ